MKEEGKGEEGKEESIQLGGRLPPDAEGRWAPQCDTDNTLPAGNDAHLKDALATCSSKKLT